VTLGEGDDAADFYLLPFIRPGDVRACFPEEELRSYDEAMRCVIRHMTLSPDRPSVLVAHQFVTAGGIDPERSDSEVLSLGGTDNVDVSDFLAFTYVALGHIHRPQRLTRDSVRYAGSPLKYSFSEANHQKSVTLVTLHGKSEPEITLLPLTPLHDLREIRGPIDTLLRDEVVNAADHEDYLHITLTDTEPVADPLHRLRQVYPNICRLDFAAHAAEEEPADLTASDLKQKTPLELFDDFYTLMQGEPPADAERSTVREIMAEIWSGAEEEEI
jgi:exonuclease SbcD